MVNHLNERLDFFNHLLENVSSFFKLITHSNKSDFTEKYTYLLREIWPASDQGSIFNAEANQKHWLTKLS